MKKSSVAFKLIMHKAKGNIIPFSSILFFPAFLVAFFIGIATKPVDEVMKVLMPVLGVYLLIFLLWGFIRIIKCSEPITAVYTGHSLFPSAKARYALLFNYKYNGKQFTQQPSIDHYRERKIKKMLEENSEYTIWINPLKPECCVCRKKRELFSYIPLIITSIAFIIIPFFV